MEQIASLFSYMKNRSQLRNRDIHAAFQNDYIWQEFGDDN